MLHGCNVPRLIAIIIQELKNEEQFKAGEYERIYYDFDQLLPDEEEREVIQRQIDEETARIELEQAIQQRKEYIHFVTSEIMQHVIDMGITLFMVRTSFLISDSLFQNCHSTASRHERSVQEDSRHR